MPTKPAYIDYFFNDSFSLDEEYMISVARSLEEYYLNKQVVKEPEKTILQQKVNILINHRLNIDSKQQGEVFFPESIINDEFILNYRLCWATGDLPIAFLLLKAAIILQNKDLDKLSNIVGLFTLMRKREEQTMVTSSEFRWGASGLALLYQSFYRTTNIIEYLKGADFWRKQTDIFLLKELKSGFYQEYPEQYAELLKALEEYETQTNGIWRQERRINFWQC